MSHEGRPPWLVRQENGEIGEARTRAFLLDRMWVLERSVDIEGADFIVQRRLTQQSLLDPSAPRLGVVQTKYFASTSTTQYIHREYVVTPEGSARTEFFLVLHTGLGDDAKAYLLSAKEIVSDFKVMPSEHSYGGRFQLAGSAVLSSRYQIMNPDAALDRIERALRDADFRSNRSFLSWALPSRSESPPIHEIFVEPIDNWWGDIPRELERLRQSALSARYDLEATIEKLRQIEEADDPEKALEIARDIEDDWISHPPSMFDADFECAVRRHRKRYEQLDSAGARPAHLFLRKHVAEFILNDLAPQMPLERSQAYVVRLYYNAASLENPRCVSRVLTVAELFPNFVKTSMAPYDDAPATRGILAAQPGDIEMFVLAGRYMYGDFERGGKSAPDPRPWREKLTGVVDGSAALLLQHLLDLRFGEL